MPPRVLPLWPHILFGLIEPALWYEKAPYSIPPLGREPLTVTPPSTMGWYSALSNPQEYHNAQVPSTIPHLTITPGTTVLALQMGNVLLLLAALAVLCCFTPHPEIARRYLMIVALADIGHIYSCYAGMGSQHFWDFSNYNDMAYGNIGGSAFLCVNRVATVLGLYGEIRNQASGKSVKKA